MILNSVIYFYVFLLWGTCINDAASEESPECCCDEKKEVENIFRFPMEGSNTGNRKNYTNNSEDIFRKIGNDSDIIHTSETLDKGYYTALCWSEIMTLTERKNGTKSIIKEYAITFETQADIPEKYLKVKHSQPEFKQYRIYNQHTKRSQVVNFTTISRTDDVIVRQHRRMLCGSGPIYTKEFINWPRTNRKRIEIKVSPKRNNLLLAQQFPGNKLQNQSAQTQHPKEHQLTTFIYFTTRKPHGQGSNPTIGSHGIDSSGNQSIPLNNTQDNNLDLKGDNLDLSTTESSQSSNETISDGTFNGTQDSDGNTRPSQLNESKNTTKDNNLIHSPSESPIDVNETTSNVTNDDDLNIGISDSTERSHNQDSINSSESPNSSNEANDSDTTPVPHTESNEQKLDDLNISTQKPPQSIHETYDGQSSQGPLSDSNIIKDSDLNITTPGSLNRTSDGGLSPSNMSANDTGVKSFEEFETATEDYGDLESLTITTTEINQIANLTIPNNNTLIGESYDEIEDVENSNLQPSDLKKPENETEATTLQPDSSTDDLSGDSEYLNTSKPELDGESTNSSAPLNFTTKPTTRGSKIKNIEDLLTSYKSLDYDSDDDKISSLKTTDPTVSGTSKPLTTDYKHPTTLSPLTSPYGKTTTVVYSATNPVIDDRTPFEFGGSANRIGFDDGHPTNMSNANDTTAVYPDSHQVKNSTQIVVPSTAFNDSRGKMCTIPKQRISIKVMVQINYVVETDAQVSTATNSLPILGLEKEIEIPIEGIKDALTVPDETVNQEWHKLLGDIGNHFFDLKKPFLKNFTEYVNNNLNDTEISKQFNKILPEETAKRIRVVKDNIDECKKRLQDEDVAERFGPTYYRYPNDGRGYQNQPDYDNPNNPFYNYLMSAFPTRGSNYQYGQPQVDSSQLPDYKTQLLQSLGLSPQLINEIRAQLLNEYRRQTRNIYPSWVVVRNVPSMYSDG